jgi:hypothetical protein|nr:MAG TPA: hypothetical protein [Caudoviricetes sp.]
MDRKLNRISLTMILVGILFILSGQFSMNMDRTIYKAKQNAVNDYKQSIKEKEFTIQIQNNRKANVKVLGYKPNSNTKETILEAYGIVKLKQNNNGLEIIVDTESGE